VPSKNELPLEEYHRAGLEILNGNPEGYKPLYSRRDDVTLANPFGPPVRAGVRSPPHWTAPPRTTGMVKSSDSKTSPPSSALTSPTPSKSRATEAAWAERRKCLRSRFGSPPPFDARTASAGRAQARRPDHRAAPTGVRDPDIAP
jgi:hypothetical protein